MDFANDGIGTEAAVVELDGRSSGFDVSANKPNKLVGFEIRSRQGIFVVVFRL